MSDARMNDSIASGDQVNRIRASDARIDGGYGYELGLEDVSRLLVFLELTFDLGVGTRDVPEMKHIGRVVLVPNAKQSLLYCRYMSCSRVQEGIISR